MQEISENLSSVDMSQLNSPVNNPPAGMSQEELRRMEQLKRQISDLIPSQ